MLDFKMTDDSITHAVQVFDKSEHFLLQGEVILASSDGYRSGHPV